MPIFIRSCFWGLGATKLNLGCLFRWCLLNTLSNTTRFLDRSTIHLLYLILNLGRLRPSWLFKARTNTSFRLDLLNLLRLLNLWSHKSISFFSFFVVNSLRLSMCLNIEVADINLGLWLYNLLIAFFGLLNYCFFVFSSINVCLTIECFFFITILIISLSL